LPACCRTRPLPSSWSSIGIGWPASVWSISRLLWVGCGQRLVVGEEADVADDLVREVTEVLRSLCAGLYGRGSAKRRAQAGLDAAAAGAG
jgi:hypothetical protein